LEKNGTGEPVVIYAAHVGFFIRDLRFCNFFTEQVLAKARPRTKESDINLFKQFATIHGQLIDEEEF